MVEWLVRYGFKSSSVLLHICVIIEHPRLQISGKFNAGDNPTQPWGSGNTSSRLNMPQILSVNLRGH